MGPLVLVVENETDLVTTYERLLRRQGCSVTAARTLRDGLKALDSGRFALVIADLRLPDGSGLDVVRSARERADGPPVIVVTGFASAESRREALNAGATAYMAKPFSTLALASLIQELLAPPAVQMRRSLPAARLRDIWLSSHGLGPEEVRDGRPGEIPATDLVPGDLVVVTAGRPFPADGLVVAGQELQADESALTGEAYPVRKRPLDPSVAAAASVDVVVDGASWGFAGTRLLTNEATLRVA